MPEQTSIPTDPQTPSEPDQPEVATSSVLGKMKVLLFLVGVVTIECLIAYLYLPSRSETAAMANAALGVESQSQLVQREEKPNEEELVDQLEVDLGEFSVTAFQPISNTALRIDFHLYGTVAAEDYDEFMDLKEENEHRFREQVIMTIRSADITDLTDAGLGLIKRKILEKTNRTFGKPLLRVIIFSDFSFVEQ